MTLKFTKMHGLGNDFIVIDGINQSCVLSKESIADLAKRHTGIGFDQCLIIEPSPDSSIDFYYRIFNADGQEVGQCGNGARCLALFARHYGLTQKDKIRVSTKTTQMNLIINENNMVTVDMGNPSLTPTAIPLIADHEASSYILDLTDGQPIEVHAISVGNPHAVLLVNDIEAAPVSTLGPLITHHPRFPEETNTGFMQILSPNHIKLRVHERGSGETQACGSGAVAAAAIGRLFHHLTDPVTVSLRGGDLLISWPDFSGPITLTGPATFVYEGHLL
jgi:diaminopimelate epimerase